MSDASSQNPSSHAGRWALWICVALVAYVLSIGPVAALWMKMYGRGRQSDALYYVYLPVGFMVDKTPALQPGATAYMEWWYRVFGVSEPWGYR